MQLQYLSIPALIGAAGGDPWAINASLQAGSPLQTANLAGALRKAGRCTKESNDAFEQARIRFEAAWNHQNGDHPITGSDEVQRVTKALIAQLTVTALHDSSVDRAQIWLTARPGPAAVPASAGPHRAPGSGTREGH